MTATQKRRFFFLGHERVSRPHDTTKSHAGNTVAPLGGAGNSVVVVVCVIIVLALDRIVSTSRRQRYRNVSISSGVVA